MIAVNHKIRHNSTLLYQELLSLISTKLSAEKCRSISLVNGKIGLLLFFALFSENQNDDISREKANDLFSELIQTVVREIRTLDRKFFNGALSIIWACRLLMKLDIIENSDELSSILEKYFSNKYYLNIAPSILLPDDFFYGEAITALSLFEDEETLKRYSLQEHLIAMVDYCERLLTTPVPGLFSPDEIEPSFLHSMMFFLTRIEALGFYPTKVRHLYEIIHNRMQSDTHPTDLHSSLLYYIIYGTYPDISTLLSSDIPNLCHTLSFVGLYSVIYENPSMLFDILKDLSDTTTCALIKYVESDTKDSNCLIGFAIGLMYAEITKQ